MPPIVSVLFLHAAEERELKIAKLPFTIGRRTDKDLVIPDPRVSREHAEIRFEKGAFFLIDLNSKLGTFVNGQRIVQHQLVRDDVVTFASGTGVKLIFDPSGNSAEAAQAREFLSQISNQQTGDRTSELEKLAMFMEAARALNTAGAFDEILLALIATTIKLTRAGRGFIFIRHEDGSLKLAAACTAEGERLFSDETISHSLLEDAAKGASEFLITDTSMLSNVQGRDSIVRHDLRAVLAIPLRHAHAASGEPTIGVLYLDSHFVTGALTAIGHDILAMIAREAAALVESTRLAQAEEASKQQQKELSIAAAIQQRLMNLSIPDLVYGRVNAKSLACTQIGGDFFDVVCGENEVTVVLADVSGKGVSAAILASILQGLIYAQVSAARPLAEIVSSANRFLCERVQGHKYATMVMARLTSNGDFEYVNCGHVAPLKVSNGVVEKLTEANLPVGLFEGAEFSSGRGKLAPGDRILLLSDGVTEAENADGDFFDSKLEAAVRVPGESCVDGILVAVREHCCGVPLNDDCTLLELAYQKPE